MARQRPCAMYQRVNFAKRSIVYERTFRREVARFEAFHKPKPGQYKRETRWWQGYAKKLPAPRAL